MATLPPPSIKEFPDDSLEKKVYTMVNSLEENIPLLNDRNRLGFALVNYLKGQGDPPDITVRNNKLMLKNISEKELADLLESKIMNLKS
ncbi:MAG: hypothetical protein R3250_00595 [Melioribacteraceae bacterium]|nr:hypothetical protein [Melioribacteraceae bacterium]